MLILLKGTARQKEQFSANLKRLEEKGYIKLEYEFENGEVKRDIFIHMLINR